MFFRISHITNRVLVTDIESKGLLQQLSLMDIYAIQRSHLENSKVSCAYLLKVIFGLACVIENFTIS